MRGALSRFSSVCFLPTPASAKLIYTAAPASASPARSTASIIPSGATTPHPQPKDHRMRKAAETPCKQGAFRDPPRTPAGPAPDPFPSNTPAKALPSRLGGRPSSPPWLLDVRCRVLDVVSRFRVHPPSAVPSRRTGPPVAVGASALRRAGAPALAEALHSRLGGWCSNENEGKGFGKGGRPQLGSLLSHGKRSNLWANPSHAGGELPSGILLTGVGTRAAIRENATGAGRSENCAVTVSRT